MGYYTRFTIEICKGDLGELSQIADYLTNITDYSFAVAENKLTTSEPIKWYEYEEEMLLVSQHYPNYLFVVTGIGEDNGDMWRIAYLTGEQVWKWILDSVIPEVPLEIQQLVKDTEGVSK